MVVVTDWFIHWHYCGNHPFVSRDRCVACEAGTYYSQGDSCYLYSSRQMLCLPTSPPQQSEWLTGSSTYLLLLQWKLHVKFTPTFKGGLDIFVENASYEEESRLSQLSSPNAKGCDSNITLETLGVVPPKVLACWLSEYTSVLYFCNGRELWTIMCEGNRNSTRFLK